MTIQHKKKLTITQRLMHLRSRRTKEKDIPVLAPGHSKLGMKYNVKKFHFRDANGILQVLSPKTTFWYKAYIETPNIDNPKFHKKFRLRFRMPHSSFVQLLEEIKHHELFFLWDPARMLRSRHQISPISLLLLGSLRYMGRGWTMDDLEEATGINQETHRKFFHQFVKYEASILYKRYVSYPINSKEAETHMEEFTIAGMNGAFGSMDAAHVIIERCLYRLKHNHLGGKSHLTCCPFNITTNHRRQILHTIPGHPACWNDKTIVLFNKLEMELRSGAIMKDHTFIFS